MTTTTLPSGNTTSAAHKTRNELATKHGVQPRYINFGDCMKVAMGIRTASKVRNSFGKILGTGGDKLVNLLICDPETPVTWGFGEMVDRAVNELGLSRHRAKKILDELRKAGYLRHEYGFWSVVSSKRPFPQPMVA